MKSQNCVFSSLITILLLLVFIACISEPSKTSESSTPDKPKIKTKILLIPDSDTSAGLSGQPEEGLAIHPYTVYIYDRNGHQIAEDWFSPYDAEWFFEYDDTGNVLKYSRLDSDGSLAASAEFQYDNAGNVLKRIVRTPKPAWVDNDDIDYVESPTVFKYDDDGNWHELSMPDEDTFLHHIIHKYDENGNEVEVGSIGTRPGLGTTTALEYDENGNYIQMVNYNVRDGVRVYISLEKFKYDESGNMIELTEYSPYTNNPPISRTIVTYTEFDEYNNWTKSIGLTEILPEGNILPDDVEYREYTYY